MSNELTREERFRMMEFENEQKLERERAIVKPQRRWEYRKESVTGNSPNEMDRLEQDLLNQASREGWELSGVLNPTPWIKTLYFQREIFPDKNQPREFK